jgi:serine/threonine protein kinase
LIRQEVQILNKLDHPSIAKFIGAYESPKHIYFVMEYCAGIDLFDRIVKSKEAISEQKTAQIMKCLFKAINHCHAKNIAHRDLKPENIMFEEVVSPNGTTSISIKIIDFGLAK